MDANKYFEMKYFLTEDSKKGAYNEYLTKLHSHW